MTANQSDSSANISREVLRDLSRAEPHTGGAQTSCGLNLESWSFDPVDCSPIDIVISNQQGEEIKRCSFDQPFVLIGRSPHCDLTLNDKQVSFRHAYIQRLFGRIVCVDLSSRNGIYWGDIQCPFGWFEEQTSLRIAGYDIHLNSSAQRAIPEEPDFDVNSFFRTNSNQSILPTVSLQYLSKSGEGESWTVNRPITLAGASSQCKLRLRNRTVSKVHCSLLLMPDGLWVVDLLGKHGTIVNGERVRHSRIADGAILKIGCYAFRVSYEKSQAEQPRKEFIENESTHTGISEEFVSRLIGQVADMQQELFKQSQRQTEMTLKLFERMHENQNDLLRDGMNRVHEINREMGELRALLEGPRTADVETAVYNTTEFDTAEFDTKDYHQNAKMPSAQVETSSGQVGGELQASKEVHEDVNVDCGIDGIESLQAPKRDVESANTVDIQDEEQSAEAGIDHHAWALDRMSTLERERESILKKVMRSIFTSTN